MNMIADGELLVVETDEELYLGTAEATPAGLVMRSGFVGRPTVLRYEDVVHLQRYDDWFELEGSRLSG
jgi:hypothetical protein